MNKIIFPLLIAAGISVHIESGAQNRSRQKVTETLTLSDVITLAKNQSIASLSAATRKENSYWSYRVFRSNYNPRLYMNGTFPDFSHTYDEVRQNDGTYDYPQVNINNSSLSLNLAQSIGQLGTSLYVSSSLRRFDNLDNNDVLWSGNPVAIGLRQPLFRFNQLKWDSKIEPLRYEESKKQFAEDLESISIETARRFFNLLDAQISFEIASKNLANNDTIYRIGQGRYNLGKIAENELLQLELNVMTARQQAAEARVSMEAATLRLKSFVGLVSVDSIYLVLPADLPDIIVDEEIALEEARKNRPDAVGFRINQLEAEQNLAQAKGETGFAADLMATYGLTNRSDAGMSELYHKPQNSQTLNIGFNIPILDWGREKSRIKTAEANLKLAEYSNQQDEMNFDEGVLTQVQQFIMLHEQVKIAERTDFIANKRYDITRNRYLIGKISITDLNLALQDKDLAKRAYINSLRNYWSAYYTLRQLTLYDFQKNQSLYTDEDK